MNGLTLKQLRYFLALAREGHVGRAAELSAISQPALSMQIKELEENLGVPLFERTGRRLALTALGQDFAERVAEVLRAVDELGEFARASADALSGPIRIGVIPTVAPYLLPRVIGDLTRDFPELEFRVRETITPRLTAELIEGRLDAAIVALPMSEPMLAEVPLFDETFVLVRPEADADHPVPDADGLRELRLLLLEEGHCFRDQALSFCNIGTARRPREIMDASSLSTLVQMVGAGIGVTLIPEMAVAVETRSAPVAIARFAAPEPQRTIGMVWRRTSPMARHLDRIAEAVRRSAGAAPGADAVA